jgi:hypothetical protein
MMLVAPWAGVGGRRRVCGSAERWNLVLPRTAILVALKVEIRQNHHPSFKAQTAGFSRTN